MDLKTLKTLQTENYELSKIQGYTKEFASQLEGNKFLTGISLTIHITTAGISVDHKLGKVPSGWIITDINSNAVIWRVSWDDKKISLDSSATSTITIWVF